MVRVPGQVGEIFLAAYRATLPQCWGRISPALRVPVEKRTQWGFPYIECALNFSFTSAGICSPTDEERTVPQIHSLPLPPPAPSKKESNQKHRAIIRLAWAQCLSASSRNVFPCSGRLGEIGICYLRIMNSQLGFPSLRSGQRRIGSPHGALM